MTQTPDRDIMTLAGLAAANGPWLAVRLNRLAEHAGRALARDVVEKAVVSTSLALVQVLDAEGRPAVSADYASDPVIALGREQAQIHRQAGLSMPDSLRVQRLLRRAYDDLVRESWVEQDSRARAHEDVERFFERALIGLVETWTGVSAAPENSPGPAQEEGLAALLARREDELRRAMEAAQKLVLALRQSRKRGDALTAELAQAQAQTKDVAALKTEFASAHAAAQAELQALHARIRDLEAALAAQGAAGDARNPAQAELEAARLRSEFLKFQEDARDLQARAEARTRVAEAQAEALRAELRQAKEAYATLASDAEAMRTRLSETGSRLAEARRAEEEETQARLAQAASDLTQARERIAALEDELRQAGQDAQAQVQALEARLAEQESQHAFKDERLREQSRAVQETQELLARLGAAKDDLAAQAEALRADLADHAARLRQAEAKALEAAEQAAQAQEIQARAERERNDAERRAADAVARSGEAALEAENQAKARLDELDAARNASIELLATHLSLTPDAVAALDGSGGFLAWNKRFPALFGLSDETLAAGLAAALPQMAARLQRPEPFLTRLHELLADPALSEEGLTLASARGETLVFRSLASRAENGGTGRLLNFRDVSLEHDMEDLVREIESITRYELGQSLTAFIHLPEELLDDPAVTPEQARKLTVIRDSGYRIVNTVNMAVDIFRMERGLYQMPPHRSLDLAVVARRAAKDAIPLAASRHVELALLLGDVPLPQDVALPGPGDPILAHGLTLNLLRDALEAAPRNSGVSAVLREDDIDQCLRLDITRQGALTSDEAAAYFDKPVGQDADNGLKRARYAAQLITKSLGGTLDVISSFDAGTTLALRLPKE